MTLRGLASFQDDVARIISETTDQSSTLCDLDGLQGLVGERINDVERDGLLAEFLISSIRDGRELTTADLAVSLEMTSRVSSGYSMMVRR